LGALDSIAESVKSVYQGLEDAYYGILDQIDEKIPVYSIIEPIDKVVPSFALFLVLAVLLVVVLLTLLVALILPSTATLHLNVVDVDGEAIEAVTLSYELDGKDMEGITDSDGKFDITGMALDTRLLIEATKDGYVGESDTFDLDSAEVTGTLTLDEEGALFVTKTIRLVDEFGQAVAGSFTLSFQCQNLYVNPPSDVSLYPSDYGVARVDVPTNCEELRVSVRDAERYSDLPFVIVGTEDFSITLQELDLEEGTITVSVYSNNELVDDVQVELYRYNDLAANPDIGPIDYKTTSGGMVIFSKTPGDYLVKAYDPQGRYAEKSSGKIDLGSGGAEEVSLSLVENIIGQIKVQIVDTDSGEPLGDARVKLKYPDGVELTTLTTDIDAEGVVSFNISQDLEYVVTAVAEGYALGTLNGVRKGEQVNLLELAKCTPTTCGTLMVKVIDQDGLNIRDAIVALYKGETDFLADYGEEVSDINGIARFRGVSSGSYYAFAFKEAFSGRSQEAYFSSTGSDDNSVDLTVTMTIATGSVKVNVRDKEGGAIPFAVVNIYNSLNNEIIGSDYTDANGVYTLDTKADKKVYVVVRKKDSSPQMADYITVSKPVLPSTVQVFNATMEPEIINKDIEIKLLGLFNGDYYAKTLASGEEYTAKLQIRVPEEKDYDETGIHFRTGDMMIMEKDHLFIKEVNIPEAAIIKASRFDEGSSFGEDDYMPVLGDGKWFNARWRNPIAGIYEAEATIQVKETASIGNELLIFYRAWAANSDDEYDPEDETIEYDTLYNNTYHEDFQVGVSTLCDDSFCFSASIEDLEEDLIESVSDSYQAKIANEYKLKFTIINNSDTRIHDSANLRISNEDDSLLIESYRILDAETREILNPELYDYEMPWIDVGNLQPHKKISGELVFLTKKSVVGLLNIRLVSDQQVVYDKVLSISISALNEFDVSIAPGDYPSGIEYDINVFVKNRATNLEVEEAIVRLKDRHGNVIMLDESNKAGYADLTLPAQLPGTVLTVEIEKANYNPQWIDIEVNPNVLKVTPDSIGVSLNAKNKHEATDSFTIRNQTTFPLKVTNFELSGDFKDYLDEGSIANWLETFNDLVIDEGGKKDLSMKTYLGEEGKLIESSVSLEGMLEFDAENFGTVWHYSIPVTISLGVGAEVDDPKCLILTRQEWINATQGSPITIDLEIQNNCTVSGTPISIRNLSAQVEWNGNQIGEFALIINTDDGALRYPLRSGYYKTIQGLIEAEEDIQAALEFTPLSGVSGVADATIKIQAHNPVDGDKDQELTAEVKAEITVITLAKCVNFDRDLVEIPYNEQGGTASFVIETKGCGSPVEFELESDLETSMDEFTLSGDDSKTIDVYAGGNYPGQYAVLVNAKGGNLEQDGVLKNVRVRVLNDPEACFQLNRYEFDIYDDPDDEYDGYDTAELTNICAETEETVKVDTKSFENAMKEASKWALLTFATSFLGCWSGGADITSCLGFGGGTGSTT